MAPPVLLGPPEEQRLPLHNLVQQMYRGAIPSVLLGVPEIPDEIPYSILGPLEIFGQDRPCLLSPPAVSGYVTLALLGTTEILGYNSSLLLGLLEVPLPYLIPRKYLATIQPR
jgi:hypothetical protein